MIYIENESQKLNELDFDYEKLLEDSVMSVLEAEGFTTDIELSVLFTDDEGIRQINADTRQIDEPTDVLSFPMIEFDGAPGIAGFDSDRANLLPGTNELILGDIVLNITRVLSQAKSFGHSAEREYSFLVVHSMLHLLGYDHIDESDRKIMETKQKDIMQGLGINR